MPLAAFQPGLPVAAGVAAAVCTGSTGLFSGCGCAAVATGAGAGATPGKSASWRDDPAICVLWTGCDDTLATGAGMGWSSPPIIDFWLAVLPVKAGIPNRVASPLHAAVRPARREMAATWTKNRERAGETLLRIGGNSRRNGQSVVVSKAR